MPEPHRTDRDRFVAFAFAAAELLVETGPEGQIVWAGGAFASRLGAPGETFVGQPVHNLVSPADRPALRKAVSRASLQGRLPPIVVHLADPHHTACALGALALPGAGGRLCVTFAALPAPPAPVSPRVADRAELGREAEASLRAGQPASLGLLDLSGWASARLPAESRRRIGADIASALAERAGPGTVATDLTQGRFGVLGQDTLDLPALIGTVEAVLRLTPATATVSVSGRQLALPAPDAADEQAAGRATRALRYAMASFARGGAKGLDCAGFQGGLAGFLTRADAQATALGARIAHRRFRLVYQPVVRLDTRAIHHFEALLRPLPDPDSPGQSTQDFVSYAEAVGLSEQLDLAVVADVTATLARARDTRAAANVSGLSMQSAAFRDRLLALVPADGRLLVELTETADITDTDAAATTIAALRAAGVEVAIDDFGAGSAAFRYLRDFRVDHVKIDGSYVRAARDSARDRELVASMRDMAHGLGAAVIAEMIETEETAALMAELGVTFGQGYLFGRPGHLPGTCG